MSSGLQSPDSGLLLRKPVTHAILAVGVSFLLALVILSVRNTYDDEFISLGFVKMAPARIIDTVNNWDVHPPGMYLLAHMAYEVIPSFRWMTVVELVFLYTGLVIFVVQLVPLFSSPSARTGFVLLATLHPQFLLWGNTIRWYGWWTGLALVVLMVALNPGIEDGSPALSRGRCAVLGMLLAGLFYINYVTLLFGVALGMTMWVHYPRRLRPRMLLAVVIFAVLILPQVKPALLVHIRQQGAQRTGVLVSFARLIQGELFSEAYLPWHPLALLAALSFCVLLAIAVVRRGRTVWTAHPVLNHMVVFSMLFFLLMGAAGLGGKPRNALLLVPTTAVLFALILEIVPVRAGSFCLGLWSLWIAIGAQHLVGRTGLGKSYMINRPEEVVAYLQGFPKNDCAVVVTYDPLLLQALVSADLPRVETMTPRAPIFLGHRAALEADCAHLTVHCVHSYIGEMNLAWQFAMDQLTATIAKLPAPRTRRFSTDPDAAFKRKLAALVGSAQPPFDRYQVTTASVPRAEWEKIKQELYFFTTEDSPR